MTSQNAQARGFDTSQPLSGKAPAPFQGFDGSQPLSGVQLENEPPKLSTDRGTMTVAAHCCCSCVRTGAREGVRVEDLDRETFFGGGLIQG